MVGRKGKTAIPAEKPLSLNNPWNLYFADPDRQASTRGLENDEVQKGDIYPTTHSEVV